MAARIQVRVEAYIVELWPQSLTPAPRPTGSSAGTSHLLGISLGLALPSFWTRHEITQAFDDANTIWKREADIEFTPVTISERSESVPPDEKGMWIHFVNNLSPKGKGIGVGFVYDLPSDEGGWGGGRIAVLSNLKASEGGAGFAGNLLAHELGHVLMDDPLHAMANKDPNNLMYGSRNPKVTNKGTLTPKQVELARTQALKM